MNSMMAPLMLDSVWLRRQRFEEEEANYFVALVRAVRSEPICAAVTSEPISTAVTSEPISTAVTSEPTLARVISAVTSEPISAAATSGPVSATVDASGVIKKGKKCIVMEDTKTSRKEDAKSMSEEISAVRGEIKAVLNQAVSLSLPGVDTEKWLQVVGMASSDPLKKTITDILIAIRALELRVEALEKHRGHTGAVVADPRAPLLHDDNDDDEDDGSFDFLGDSSDDEDDEEKQRRLAAYKAKKASKPALVAKSSIVLDCKPWDDETDLSEMERMVRSIGLDGLVWGAARCVELAYGIQKLSIVCTVEDDKISVEDLQERIEGFGDLVQSCDIAAFNKV